MKVLLEERKRAIELRQRGLSYREILREVHVSKSSLSLWLKNTPISEEQQKILLRKRENSWISAGIARRRMRLAEEIKESKRAKAMIGSLSRREIFLVASALYWAEGSKLREHSSQGVSLGNSDPGILLVFYKWLRNLGYLAKDIRLSLYFHEVFRSKEHETLLYWKTFFPESDICWGKTVWKKHSKKRPYMRYNKKSSGLIEGFHSKIYRGVLRLDLKKSTKLNRFLAGSSRAICEQCRVV